MSDATRTLERLRSPNSPHLASLARLTVEDALVTPIAEVATPRWMASQLATMVEAATHGPALRDFIEDPEGESQHEILSNIILEQEIEGLLDRLTPREHEILRLRYGLDDGQERTLREIGARFDVTRERIRQIEAEALRALRGLSREEVPVPEDAPVDELADGGM